MAITREEALATLEEGRARVEDLVSRLGEEEFERPGTIGGGDWSARDLVAHLAHWEELAQEAALQWREGRAPDIEQVFLGDGVDALNAEEHARNRGLSGAEVRRRAAAAHAAIVATINSISDEEWSAKAPFAAERRRTLGFLLASIMGAPGRGFGHAFAHLDDLEAYVRSVSG